MADFKGCEFINKKEELCTKPAEFWLQYPADSETSVCGRHLVEMLQDGEEPCTVSIIPPEPDDPATVPIDQAPESLQKKLTARAELATRVDEKEADFEELKKELKAMDKSLMEMYAIEGVTSLKVPGIGTFTHMTRDNAKILPEKKAEAMAKLKLLYPDLVKETVNGNTFSAFVRQSIKTGQELPADLMALLKVSKSEWIQWR